jgi:hypothetical protein
MKKLLLLAAIMVGTAASVSAQGTVAFNNLGNTNWRIWTNSFTGQGSNLMSSTLANGYRIGLYVAQTNVGSSFELAGTAGNTAPFGPGFFQGGSPFTLPAGYAGGTPINFQLRAWSFAGGGSFETALSAAASDPLGIALGQSLIGTVTPAGAGSPPSALFGTTAGLLTRGFGVAPVPEPSTIALGLLGLGAIALFRRRK